MTKSDINLDSISAERLDSMAAAGDVVVECYRVLQKSDTNVVGEVLRDEGTFYELDHYPKGDAYDQETHSQYYYHAHRESEHGHFHTFLREAGMPAGLKPVEQSHAPFMDERKDTLSHLIAISMDNKGFPIGLFTTNRWVTADTWYAATNVIAMLDAFDMDMARPSWATNLWITNMVRLFRPEIEALIHERDEKVAAWRQQHPGEDVFEDRDLEITSFKEISVERQIARVREASPGHRN